jgi:hypothetical protein
MPGARPRLTAQLIGDLCDRVKAGAYEQVAAESLGVPFALYQQWLARGEGRRARSPYRDLVRAMQQARAHARLMAETDMRANNPKVWLLHGPGKETEALPGWTALARPRPGGEAEPLNVLLHPEIVALFNAVLEALLPHPEAHAAVLRLLAEPRPAGEKATPDTK